MINKIKVLIVCSGNFPEPEKNLPINHSFIFEQAISLEKNGIDVEFFLIKGKGIFGYLNNFLKMTNKIREFNPDIVHAHYGFSGMLAVLQRKVPVIVTFHGSDINDGGLAKAISMLTYRLSNHSIFVSTKLLRNASVKKKLSVISCGVDMDQAIPLNKIESRKKLNFNLNDKYVLFSSSFDNPVKNYQLAKEVIDKLNNVNLVELKGYSRTEVNLLMNACDLILVTSTKESGPLVVKEAVACGCPVVSTDVGDVKEIIGGIDGCYVTDFSANEISNKIQLILDSGKRIEARNMIYVLELDADTVAKKILNIYKSILVYTGQ